MDEKLEHLEQLNSQKVNLQNNIQVWEDEKLNLTVQMEELKNNHEKENLKRKWNVQKWKKQTIKDSIQSLQSNNEELKKRSTGSIKRNLIIPKGNPKMPKQWKKAWRRKSQN